VCVAPATTLSLPNAPLIVAATLKDAGGNTLTGRTVVWTSSSTSAATVNSSSGLVTGVAAGTATITATSESKSGSAAITVTASSGGGATFGHVFLVTEENTNYSNSYGSAISYLTSLANP